MADIADVPTTGATVFTLRGLDDPIDSVGSFFEGRFTGVGNTLERLLYPQATTNLGVTLPGSLPASILDGLDSAVEMLDDALTDTVGPKIVMAHGLGACVATLWLNQLGPTSAVDPDEVWFILTANPIRKYGGVVYDTDYAVPEDTLFTVFDIANQYDGWADWPGDLPQSSDSIAVMNALLSLVSPINDYVNLDPLDTDLLELVEDNITYLLSPTYPVPIVGISDLSDLSGFFNILDNPLFAAADQVIRPLIEAIYDRIFGFLPPPPYPPPATTPPVDPPPDAPPGTPPLSSAPCLDPNHFYVKGGGIRPTPWMQHRLVATATVGDKSGTYEATSSQQTINPSASLSNLFGPYFTGVGEAFSFGGLTSGIGGDFLDGSLLSPFTQFLDLSGSLGGLFSGVSQSQPDNPAAANKNDLLQTAVVQWTNATPVDQWVYGMITRGGSRVTLQCRSRGYLVMSSGYAEGRQPGDLKIASIMGCGGDIGLGGVLAIGTSYAIVEQRQNALTIPLAPERCGWYRLAPGKTFTGAAQVRFVTEFWENGQIDGGNGETESGYDSGELRLDLFASPVIE